MALKMEVKYGAISSNFHHTQNNDAKLVNLTVVVVVLLLSSVLNSRIFSDGFLIFLLSDCVFR